MDYLIGSEPIVPHRLPRLLLLAAAFYALLAFILLHPLLFNNGTRVAGFDYFNYNWNFWWLRHALSTPGLNVYLNDFVMAPHVSSFGYHALTAVWFPLWALVEPLVGTLTAMNIIIFLMCFLNGFVLFGLLLREGAHPALALLGGFLLQASPVTRYFYYNTHINLGDWFWLPTVVLLWGQIIRAAQQGRLSRALLWGGVLGLVLWAIGHTDLQFPIFVAFWLVPYALYTLWRLWRAPSVGASPTIAPTASLPVHGLSAAVPVDSRGGVKNSVLSTQHSALITVLLAASLALVIAAGLLWFAGPLHYMRSFTGTLAPGPVEDRPGIPFPRGYLSLDPVWWWWNTPTLGGSVTILLILSLLISIPILRNFLFHSPYIGRGMSVSSEQGRVNNSALSRWLWLLILLPPLILSLGPDITLFGVKIPMPFRIMHTLTGGNFRMPWRLAPIFVSAAAVFIAKTWTPILFPRFVSALCSHHQKPSLTVGTSYMASAGTPHPLPLQAEASRRDGEGRGGIPKFILVAVLLFAAFDIRLYETAPLEDVLPTYQFYADIGRERGEPYDRLVVLEVPTGAGTGETLIGQTRAIQYQFYGMTHGKRMLNGFISRAPTENFWPMRYDDPLLAWLGQRRFIEPEVVEPELRQIINDWPVGYIVVHQDDIGRNGPTPQEIIGYFNTLDDLLCPLWVERDAVVYRTSWHPDGCPPRTPQATEPGTYRIDIGAPGDERFIGWGWHWQEPVGALNWRWTGEYPQTKLYVDLPPGDYTVTIAAQAFWEPRQLSLLVKDVPLALYSTSLYTEREPGGEVDSALVLPDSLQTFAFTLPASVAGQGKHLTLTLDYDAVIVPNDVGQSADPRKLALAVDWVAFTRQ